MIKVLAVASGGGHWTQMMRLKKSFDEQESVFVGVNDMYRADVPQNRFYSIPDVSRLHKWSLPAAVIKLLFILLKERPDTIITTGSAPGMLALRLGKLFGARTVWVDSVANVEQMSLSGKQARKAADLWLTQWEHLAGADGPKYFGSVL